MKACIDCGEYLPSTDRGTNLGGGRCPGCLSVRNKIINKKKNARKERELYRDRGYRSIIPVGLCYICGINQATTKDHLISITNGGTNHRTNIKFACRSCNSKKGKGG